MSEFIAVQGHRIEFERINVAKGAPVMVFLHEGLGSVAMWRDFPAKLARAAGCNALLYSRYGYGRSDALTAPRRPNYMHDEARKALPELFEKLGIAQPVLFGHSDGASIALIYAASYPTRAVIALAPHVFVEEIALEGIRAIRQEYEISDLREKLARYHDHPDSAFRGWSEAWLDPSFRNWCIEDELQRIECPMLAVQGFNDEYATMEQIDRVARLASRVDVLKLLNCRHSPHRDRPAALIDAVLHFLDRIDNKIGTPNGEETKVQSSH
jgi:pimeloyl-ACP methyl ester carboxylesterase